MIITYFGKQFFKIQQGELTVAFNPISKDSKEGTTKFGADIALSTTNHKDYNGVVQLSHGDREPFHITGPGDYEVREIFIKGALSESNIDDKKYINTVYSLSIDNINIAFLGALTSGDISKDARESVGNPDIVFVPVSKNILDPKSAAKLALSFEPKLIIPMDYDDESLKVFLKETSDDKISPIDKLTIKRKDLDGKDAEVVIFSKN